MTDESAGMHALFIGHTYIDVTLLAEQIPSGDEKTVASDYAISFGGNAVTAAFCCAKLTAKVDLIATFAHDWLGRMFLDMTAKYDIELHTRKVRSSSLSFIMPHDGKRAIVRCRDDEYLAPYPVLDVAPFQALHLDGHQADAAIFYARRCREAGILTSLDGGGLRSNTHDLLSYIDIAIVADRFCEQLGKSHRDTLDYLKSRGCRIGGITLGERGMLWYDESGQVRSDPALPVPQERIVDTSGAGDVFHGAYIYAYLANPSGRWADHFAFAKTASAHKIQHLGNEAGLPTLADIERIRREFAGPRAVPRPAAPERQSVRH